MNVSHIPLPAMSCTAHALYSTIRSGGSLCLPCCSSAHVILGCCCCQAGEERVRRSKLNLVDLAGSERVSKTNIDGTILREAKFINLSLHYLEQVIIALQVCAPFTSTIHSLLATGNVQGTPQGWVLGSNTGPVQSFALSSKIPFVYPL